MWRNVIWVSWVIWIKFQQLLKNAVLRQQLWTDISKERLFKERFSVGYFVVFTNSNGLEHSTYIFSIITLYQSSPACSCSSVIRCDFPWLTTFSGSKFCSTLYWLQMVHYLVYYEFPYQWYSSKVRCASLSSQYK